MSKEEELKVGYKKSQFWFLHLAGTILVAVILASPYHVVQRVVIGPPDQTIIGYLWLVGVAINHEVNFDVLLFAAIHIVIFIAMVKILKQKISSKTHQKTIRKRNLRLIILGIILIATNIVLFFLTIPSEYPSVTTTSFPVGTILAFIVGGFFVFLGVLGLFKERGGVTQPQELIHNIQNLEKKKKFARKQFIILSLVFIPGLLVLIGYSLFYSQVNYYILWLIGIPEQIFTPFVIGFLAIFEFLIGIPLTLYVWQYISAKKKISETPL